ncbi:MAG: cation-translocating P-type ATPase, partial [Nanoarchaeota archaeon]
MTLNKMTVKKIYANGKVIDVTGAGYDPKGQFLYNSKEIPLNEIELLLRIGSLNNDAELKGNEVIGDPTEGALIVSAEKKGLSREQLGAEYKRIDEIEFTSERKMMATIHQYKKQKFSYVKGAPEVVLDRCDYVLVNGKAKKLSPKDKKEILRVNQEFAGNALRVLGFAFRDFKDKNSAEKNLVFVGLQAMIDPPREEVKPAIEKCNKAGIKVIMITGDHEITAKAIAREIGLQGSTITGQQLDEIKNLQDIVEDVAVFARVNPEHKIQIVDALKKKGHIVAMTGDGVNDAPALKKADIGIAMGLSGTDVAKEASAMILLDDNFASIVNAVEEGRGIYDNIKKYIGFLLSGNIGEVMIVFLGIIFGLPLALTATQILLINLVTDGLPALALTTDPFEPNAMSRKPRKQDESIFKGLRPFLIYYPIAQVITALSIFVYVLKTENNVLMAQTAAFLTIGMFELYQSLASRSTIYPAIKVGLFKNKWLILAFVSSFLVILTSIFMPKIGNIPYGEALDMAPLNPALFWFI